MGGRKHIGTARVSTSHGLPSDSASFGSEVDRCAVRIIRGVSRCQHCNVLGQPHPQIYHCILPATARSRGRLTPLMTLVCGLGISSIARCAIVFFITSCTGTTALAGARRCPARVPSGTGWAKVKRCFSGGATSHIIILIIIIISLFIIIIILRRSHPPHVRR